MSFLELIGLDALFGGDGEGLLDGFFKVGSVFLGVYVLLMIFYSQLIDKVSAVINVFIGLAIIITAIYSYIKMLKKGDEELTKEYQDAKKKYEASKKDSISKKVFQEEIAKYPKLEKQYNNRAKYAKIFLAITIVLCVAGFIVGLFIPYHCLLFDYEYRGVFSAIATPLYPVALTYLIYSIIITRGKVLDKVKTGFSMLGKFIGFYLLSAIISLFVFILVLFLKGEGFIDKYILIYHNRNYVFERMKWDCEDYKQCILEEIPNNAKEIVDYWYDKNVGNYKYFLDKGDTEMAEKIFVGKIKDTSLLDNYYNYGFGGTGLVWIDDYTHIDEVVNKEFKDERRDFFYYKFNWKTYEVEELSKEEYEKLKEEYQKTEEE